MHSRLRLLFSDEPAAQRSLRPPRETIVVGRIGELTVILQRAVAAPEGATVVVDMAAHEVRLGDTRISFAKRPVLRRLLYALAAPASDAGDACDKEALVSRVWNVAYHPLRHDNVLRVTVHNLRAALAPAQIRIELAEHAGYRLVLPGHAALVVERG